MSASPATSDDSSAAAALQTLARDGYAIIPDVIDSEMVESLRHAIDRAGEREEVRRRGGIWGIRNLLEIVPASRELARSLQVRTIAASILGQECFAVRGTLFDKNPDANWSLFWHQDSIITVKEKLEVPGFSCWSRKAGVWHTQPPFEVFERMLAVRVHLDDSFADNGPLRVLPGSHRAGWVDGDLDQWKSNCNEVVCEVGAGGVVLMRPLLLHASSASEKPTHRRVLQIEYAVDDLPGGLEWYARIGA
jgi:ectoine hydroxylase-related dioxygenase (phytanoyl-CoA dioxygenase family)